MRKRKLLNYQPAVVFDRTIDRSDTAKDGKYLSDEEQIVWLVHPAKLPRFVRSTQVTCKDRTAAIVKFGSQVVGWSTLQESAPGEGGGAFVRRVFWLANGEFDAAMGGALPVEAVDPLTIRPGVAGEVTARLTESAKSEADTVRLITQSAMVDGKSVRWLEAVR